MRQIVSYLRYRRLFFYQRWNLNRYLSLRLQIINCLQKSPNLDLDYLLLLQIEIYWRINCCQSLNRAPVLEVKEENCYIRHPIYNIYIYIRTHTHTHIYIVSLPTVFDGYQKVPFSRATTSRCKGECNYYADWPVMILSRSNTPSYLELIPPAPRQNNKKNKTKKTKQKKTPKPNTKEIFGME